MTNNNTQIIIPSFLLCLITIFLQIITMGLINQYIVSLSLCGLLVFVVCYSLIFYHRDYDSVFTYTFILTALSTLILYMLLLFRQNYDLSSTFNDHYSGFGLIIEPVLSLPYADNGLTLGIPLSLLIILNCVVPLVSGIFICLFDSYNKQRNFYKFFVHHSILLLLIYSVILIYIVFIKESIYNKETNIIPFMTIASYIEDYILGNRPLEQTVKYLLRNSILFIPYGFYVGLLTRGINKIVRLFVLSILPLFLELVRLSSSAEIFDIDRIILAVIGSIVGTVCFCFLNFIFKTIKEEEFLDKDLNPNNYYLFRN